MPKIDDEAKRWQLEVAERFGLAVAKRRKALGLTAAQLSERTRELGYPIHRVAIGKLETNARAGKVDLGELLVLAAALHVSPITLVFPGPYGDTVEVLPGADTSQFAAAQWFSGMDYFTLERGRFDDPTAFDEAQELLFGPSMDDWREHTSLNLWRTLDNAVAARSAIVAELVHHHEDPDFNERSERAQIAHYDETIRHLRRVLGVGDG